MDISDNIIYIFVIDQYLRQPCFNKLRTKFFHTDSLITGDNLRTGNNQSQTDIGKIKRIFEIFSLPYPYLNSEEHLRYFAE